MFIHLLFDKMFPFESPFEEPVKLRTIFGHSSEELMEVLCLKSVGVLFQHISWMYTLGIFYFVLQNLH